MKIVGLNRVELLLPAEDLEEAVRVFSDVLGTDIDPPHLLEEHGVLTTVNWGLGIELLAPGSESSPLHASIERKGRRGAIGPIVWEVEDIDEARRELVEKGYSITYELDTPDGGRQLSLDAAELFGYAVTFIQKGRGG